MEQKLKVLVVDDATFMVKAVSDILASDPDLEVLGSARNGLDGLNKIKALRPDVITLDIDMPVMDGITSIRHIMIKSPTPIVVLSSLFRDGAITFEALRLGIVDFLPKPSGAISQDIHKARQQIIDRIKIAASVNSENIRRVKLKKWNAREELAQRYGFRPLEYMIAIGTSLGGPNTSMRLFSKLAPTLPAAAVLVQEISPKIISAFAEKFDEHVPWKVEVAEDNTILEQGVCYVSSNENTVTFEMNSDREVCLRITEGVDRPLNTFFASAAEVFGHRAIGVLLSGIGDDGADGFIKIKEKSGATIAQDIDTCVYPNLTEHAIACGTVDIVAVENRLADEITAVME